MWHSPAMAVTDNPVAIHRTVIEGLTVDAMVLADEVESYFGGDDLESALPCMDAATQAAVARIGLKLATRLNRLVEFLVRADARHEAAPETVGTAEQLCTAEDTALLPPRARALAEAARQLLERVERLRDLGGIAMPAVSPARALQQRLENALGIARA